MAEPGLPSTDDKDMASKLQLILSQIDVMSRKLDKLDTRVTNVELDTCSLTSGNFSLLRYVAHTHSKGLFLGNFYVQLANSVTSMVGLKESVSSKYAILRWFWAALLVAGISATIFYIYETASQFLEYQAATNVSMPTDYRCLKKSCMPEFSDATPQKHVVRTSPATLVQRRMARLGKGESDWPIQ